MRCAFAQKGPLRCHYREKALSLGFLVNLTKLPKERQISNSVKAKEIKEQRRPTPHRAARFGHNPSVDCRPVNKSLCFVLNQKHLGIVCWVKNVSHVHPSSLGPVETLLMNVLEAVSDLFFLICC